MPAWVELDVILEDGSAFDLNAHGFRPQVMTLARGTR
jgi:hypothetical protein